MRAIKVFKWMLILSLAGVLISIFIVKKVDIGSNPFFLFILIPIFLISVTGYFISRIFYGPNRIQSSELKGPSFNKKIIFVFLLLLLGLLLLGTWHLVFGIPIIIFSLFKLRKLTNLRQERGLLIATIVATIFAVILFMNSFFCILSAFGDHAPSACDFYYQYGGFIF